jgi:membrane protease subunit HflC
MPIDAVANRGRRRAGAAIVLGVALMAWALIGSCFALDVTEYGVVTRFGQIVRVTDQPGLHLKAPFDAVARLDRRLLMLRPPEAEFLSADKKNVVVDSLATWRIADPSRFLASVGDRATAEPRIADVVLSEIGAVMGRYDFASFVSAGGSGDGFDRMIAQIRDRAARFTAGAYGIELVDVDILRLSMPEQNKEHVFDRMKAERGKIAKQYRSQGELEAREITARADHAKADIEADAYATVQRLRAEGDAEAARIYAAAFSRDPGFYKFLRVLLAYQQVLDDKTTLFLPANAEALGLLRYELKRRSDGAALPETPGLLAPQAAARRPLEAVP